MSDYNEILANYFENKPEVLNSLVSTLNQDINLENPNNLKTAFFLNSLGLYENPYLRDKTEFYKKWIISILKKSTNLRNILHGLKYAINILNLDLNKELDEWFQTLDINTKNAVSSYFRKNNLETLLIELFEKNENDSLNSNITNDLFISYLKLGEIEKALRILEEKTENVNFHIQLFRLNQLASYLDNDRIPKLKLLNIISEIFNRDIIRNITDDKGRLKVISIIYRYIQFFYSDVPLFIQLFEELFKKELIETEEIHSDDINNEDFIKVFEEIFLCQSSEQIFNFFGLFSRLIRVNKEPSYYLEETKDDELEKKEFYYILIKNYKYFKLWDFYSKKIKNLELKYFVISYILNCLSSQLQPFMFKEMNPLITNLDYNNKTLSILFLKTNLKLLKKSNESSSSHYYWNKFLELVDRYKLFKLNENITNEYIEYLLNIKYFDLLNFQILYQIILQTDKQELFSESTFNNNVELRESLFGNVSNYISFIHFLMQNNIELNRNLLNEIMKVEIKFFEFDERDQAAILWIQRLVNLFKNRDTRSKFYEKSLSVLKNYPKSPGFNKLNEEIFEENKKEKYSDYYDLLTYIAKVFPNITMRKILYKKMRWDNQPRYPETRKKYYEYVQYLIGSIILDWNSNYSELDDYFVICKNYLTFKYLANNTKSISTQLIDQKIEEELRKRNEFDKYLKYSDLLEDLIEKINNEQFTQKALHLSTNQNWLFMFIPLINTKILEMIPVDEFKEFLSYQDFRSLNRSFLRIFLSLNVAQIRLTSDFLLNKKNQEYLEAIKKQYVHVYMDRINANENYYAVTSENLQKIANQFLKTPVLDILISTEKNSLEENVEFFYYLFLLINEKEVSRLDSILNKVGDKLLQTLVIPYICINQYPKDIIFLLNKLLKRNDKNLLKFLDSEYIVEIVGKDAINYFKSYYYLKNQKFDLGAEYFEKILDFSGFSTNVIDDLKNSIKKQVVPSSSTGRIIINPTLSPNEQKPLSFMKVENPENESLEILQIQFLSSDEMFSSESKVKIARKIYYHSKENKEDINIKHFVFLWGFKEIEAAKNIKDRANILLELIDNFYLLEDSESLREEFLYWFKFILDENSIFTLLQRYIEKFKEALNKLIAKFPSFTDYNLYSQLLDLLTSFEKSNQSNINTKDNIIEANKISQKILILRNENPYSRFAQNAYEYILERIKQINAKGIFDVKVLNYEGKFNGSVFYQITNVGFETVRDLELTFYIEENQSDSIRLIDLKGELREGLRPKQTYAGEIVVDTPFDQDSEINCVIQLKYRDSNFTVIDSTNGGKLTVDNSDYIFERDKFAKSYNEVSITNQDHFIGRKEEIRKIVNGIINGNTILLYGTNGTGKTSIINNITDRQILELRNNVTNFDFIPIDIAYTIESDISTNNLISGVFSKILFEDSAFRNSLELFELNNPDISLRNTYFYLDKAQKQFERLLEKDHYHSDNVMEIFTTINSALNQNNLKLYIILDNFEHVVSSENIDHHDFEWLRSINERSETSSNISFIYSGSNYLLEAIGVDNDLSEAWNKIFTRSSKRIKIGNLNRDDFEELMEQKDVLNNGEIKYLPESLEYLWNYTNGHAYYSSFLGNRILELLHSKKVPRNIIYPSDIYEVIYKSKVTEFDSEKSIKSQIFQDIENKKNVKYIGKVIADLITNGQYKVSLEELRNKIKDEEQGITQKDFNEALQILLARDFITYIDEDNTNEDHLNNIAFTSNIYYDHFREIELPKFDKVEIEEDQKEKSIENIVTLLFTKSPDEVERVRTFLGNNINNIDTIYHGQNQNITNTNINIESISQTFSNVLSNNITLTTEELTSAYGSLPQLSNYLDYEIDAENEEKVDEAVDNLVKDYSVAIINSQEDLFEELSEEAILELMDLELDQLEELQDNFKYYPKFQKDLSFAMILYNIFTKFENLEEIDYSPAALLFCKLIEKMLLDLHTPVYIKYLDNFPISKGNRIKFGELEDPNIFARNQRFLTMGSYSYQISQIRNGQVRAKDENILLITNNNSRSIQFKEWKKHAVYLKRINDIRNKAAHKEHLPWDILFDLKDILFNKNELSRMIEISEINE